MTKKMPTKYPMNSQRKKFAVKGQQNVYLRTKIKEQKGNVQEKGDKK